MNFNEDIKNSLAVLRKGGVILYPTDTVWGLGCDATSRDAVRRIMRIKGRDTGKGLVILVESKKMLERYVQEIPAAASEIIEVSSTPVTIVYPGATRLAEGVATGDGSAGIRITSDKFCSELIAKFGKPIVSTSANMAGEPAPSNFGEIKASIIEAADYTVVYKRKDRKKHKASPVIKVGLSGEIRILRQ